MKFDSNAERLRVFVLAHGRLPKAKENDGAGTPCLGSWFHCRKADFKRGKLSQDRVDKLARITQDVAPNCFGALPRDDRLDMTELDMMEPHVARSLRKLDDVTNRLGAIADALGRLPAMQQQSPDSKKAVVRRSKASALDGRGNSLPPPKRTRVEDTAAHDKLLSLLKLLA